MCSVEGKLSMLCWV